MYKLMIITPLGNYLAEMTPTQEEPTNDDLMAMFIETVNEVEGHCFMEGWTPNDDPAGPPGVWAFGKDIEILAYHVIREAEIVEAPKAVEPGSNIIPDVMKLDYLGNTLTVKSAFTHIDDVATFFVYDINGETPTDVLAEEKIEALMVNRLKIDYAPDEFLVLVAHDGEIRNFVTATNDLKALIAKRQAIKGNAMAWNGWKGGEE